jgi:hypothetical protein
MLDFGLIVLGVIWDVLRGGWAILGWGSDVCWGKKVWFWVFLRGGDVERGVVLVVGGLWVICFL